MAAAVSNSNRCVLYHLPILFRRFFNVLYISYLPIIGIISFTICTACTCTNVATRVHTIQFSPRFSVFYFKRAVTIVPIYARNFNPRTLGKCFYIFICMISRHGFQTKLLPYMAQFWRFWGKNVTFSLYNQPKTEYIYKTLPPPPVFQNTTYIRDVYLYNKQSV